MKLGPGELRSLPIIMLSLWLASCAAPKPAPVEEAGPAEQAQSAESRGQYDVAAQLWLQSAAESTGSAAASFRLRAAEAWLTSGQNQRAFDLLDEILPDGLSPAEQSHYALMQAEKALSQADPVAAMQFLDRARDELDSSLQTRYQSIEQGIKDLQFGGDHQRLLAKIANDLESFNAYTLSHAIEILGKYEYVPSGRLLEAAELQQLEPRAASWADLMARIRAAILDSQKFEEAAARWQRDYPTHQVDERAFLEIGFMYGQRFSAPTNVAILLPLQGGLSAAGSAIRDGLLSAYLARPGVSNLSFLETGNSPLEALTAYRQAERDQADWIIGPVRQESVRTIAELGLTGISVLALNELGSLAETSSIQDFFTLSLSQESEARAIAMKMLETGATRAVTLITDNAWGNRMELAFADAFIAGGGEIIDIARFSSTDSDHSEELVRVLQIDQSRARKDQLQSLLGVPLSFEPHLRGDFDAFFLSSQPQLARQLRPQLRFFEAGNKPLFAVSRVYSGVPNPSTDRDLNGVILPLTNAQLEVAEAGTIPDLESVRSGSLLHLHALGRDAWNILPWLPLLQLDPDLAFPGETGDLYLSSTGRLVRDPIWAMFTGGRPVRHEPRGLLE